MKVKTSVLFGKQEIHAKLTNFEARRSNDESNLDEDQIKFAKLFFHYGGDDVSRFQTDHNIISFPVKNQKVKFPFVYQQCTKCNVAHVKAASRRIIILFQLLVRLIMFITTYSEPHRIAKGTYCLPCDTNKKYFLFIV